MAGVSQLLALDPYVTDWLDLGLRWLHVIAAIAWIGSSFYFIALDYKLEPPRDADDAAEGIGGESWEIHGGGFYHVQKYRVAPPRLPERLVWFKWEAYTTWLSGFALLILLYYLRPEVTLVDRSVAALANWQAILVSIALLAGGWAVYDVLCRLFGGRDLWLAAALLGLVVVTAWGSSELFAAQAAYLQVGAILGTIMAGNVLFEIIPAHWELIRAKEAGREPDPAPGLAAKQRSVHNNYLTLPVLFAMLAGHFPFTYGHSQAWLVLVALMVIGAWLRHFFNLHHQGRNVWAIPASAAIALGLLAFAIRPGDGGSGGAGAVPSFATVASVVAQRCATCHSVRPTDPRFSSAPLGVALDTPEEIQARAQAIKAVAVDSRVMPLGNVTGMTDAERDLLGRWIGAGAPIQ